MMRQTYLEMRFVFFRNACAELANGRKREGFQKQHLDEIMSRTRYSILVFACLAHALFLSAGIYFGLKFGIFVVPYKLWLALLCIWPIWCFVLWKYGRKRLLSVVIPMVIGLTIMWPVFLWFMFLCSH